MEAEDIERYLAELGAELKNRGLKKRVRVHWLNYLAQMLLYDEVVVPDGKLWKRFGPFHVCVPEVEYILALKITAGRQKDLEDCAILLPKTKIRTRQQAQQLLDRYISPGGQQRHARCVSTTR